MKILFACEIFPPDIGGPATYVEKIAKKMIAAGQQVLILTYSDEEIWESDKNYPFKIFRIKRQRNLIYRYFLYFLKLYRLSKNCDLIFAQGPIPSGLPSILVKILTGKNVIIKVVGDFSWERSQNIYGIKINLDEFQKLNHSFKIKIIRWLQKVVLNQAKQIIVPSFYLKRIVTGWGVKEDLVKVIYNAIEQIFCSLSPQAAKEGIKTKGDIILTAGRLTPWKNFDFLIKIFPRILEINRNFKLIIVGEGPEIENLKNLISELNLTRQIILKGQINHEEMALYYKAADLFILASSYEGLSHILIEALMMGLPIIATNIGGNPEVIENNYNGLLVEYNNEEQLITAIRKLWQAKELRDKFSSNSKESLGKFQFAEMYKQTILILSQFIGVTTTFPNKLG